MKKYLVKNIKSDKKTLKQVLHMNTYKAKISNDMNTIVTEYQILGLDKIIAVYKKVK